MLVRDNDIQPWMAGTVREKNTQAAELIEIALDFRLFLFNVQPLSGNPFPDNGRIFGGGGKGGDEKQKPSPYNVYF